MKSLIWKTEIKNLIEEYDEKSERFRKRWEERKAAEEKDANRYREANGKLYEKFLKTYYEKEIKHYARKK